MIRGAGLPLSPPLAPMEAQLVRELPAGPGWQYEPKWDGFRCLVFREGEKVELQSKSGQPLGRYFPEVAGHLVAVRADRFVLDGELMIADEQGGSAFDDLLLRIHPAASRVARLAAATPATYIVFDLLADERGRSLLEKPLGERREALERFFNQYLKNTVGVKLSPITGDVDRAAEWLSQTGPCGRTDGVMAKRTDAAYASGLRTAMQKVKNIRTADCVVGGYRPLRGRTEVGSLLLGLYDESGLLQYVGFTASLSAPMRAKVQKKIEAAARRKSGPRGFTGKSPGGPSRWTKGRTTDWHPLPPELVVEVQYDHVTDGRFRHGTRFVRWRPDKRSRACTMEQLRRGGAGLGVQ